MSRNRYTETQCRRCPRCGIRRQVTRGDRDRPDWLCRDCRSVHPTFGAPDDPVRLEMRRRC